MFSFRSAPRLREVPQKIPNLIFLSGDFHVHQSLQRPCLFVFVHLRRRPPLPHSPPRRPSVPLRLPRVVVACLQTRQRDGRERLVSSRGQRGICFLPWYLGQTLVQTRHLAQHEYI